MNLEKYEFEQKNTISGYAYFFESTGTKGIISKGVYFQTKNGFVFNLALGDLDIITRKPDFQKASNNGDIKKVIATVVGIGVDFLKQNPNVIVGFCGNEPRKTKFYQRIITSYLDELLQYFDIFGVLNSDDMEIFNPQKEYFYFYFKTKKT